MNNETLTTADFTYIGESTNGNGDVYISESGNCGYFDDQQCTEHRYYGFKIANGEWSDETALFHSTDDLIEYMDTNNYDK